MSKLESIHNQGVRTAIGAFRTSPVESILAEAGVLPLRLIRLQRLCNYGLRILSNSKHPMHQKMVQLVQRNEESVNHLRGSKLTLLGKVSLVLKDFGMNLHIISRTDRALAPWRINNRVKFDTSLMGHSRNDISYEALQKLFHEAKSKYVDHRAFYTDGSKQGVLAGYGIKGEGVEITGRIPDNSSVFSAECFAILECVKLCATYNSDNFLICTDSLSAINALKKVYARNGLIKNIQDQIGISGKFFTLMWVPAHTGIRGNEAADDQAKDAVNSPEFRGNSMTFEDCRIQTRKLIWGKREIDWREIDPNNKLSQIAKSAICIQDFSGLTRKEATVISRLKIGHTNRTHAYLFEEFQIPDLCECDEFFDFEHFFVCDLGIRARQYFGISGREMLLSNDTSILKRVIAYLKFMDWFWKI